MTDFKNILITGASSGIGEALALGYAAPGVNLYLSGRNAERLEQVASHCREKGADIHIKILNVADRETTESWVLEADTFKPLDLIIANAGVSASSGPETFESAVAVRENFSVNVDGVMNTILPIAERMKQRGKGQIAIVSSVMSFISFPGSSSYSASKAAVRVFGEGLRISIAKYGVGVSVILPAMVKTPMTDALERKSRGAMSTEKAAEIIIKGLKNNKPRIGFSKKLYFIFWLFGCLPSAITSRLFKSRKA
jgi:short-subunit dehydrogenase